MALQTKSINAKVLESDGLRICVMRKIKPEDKFDMWWPILAPSLDLLRDYRSRRISWEDYVPRYTQEVLEGQRDIVRELTDIATKRNVTILCYEETPDQCHRRLLAEECKKYEPDLEIILK